MVEDFLAWHAQGPGPEPQIINFKNKIKSAIEKSIDIYNLKIEVTIRSSKKGHFNVQTIFKIIWKKMSMYIWKNTTLYKS